MERRAIPPGEEKNSDPGQQARSVLCQIIAFVLVSLRFYVRARMVKKLWWDDFFLLLGMVGIPTENCMAVR